MPCLKYSNKELGSQKVKKLRIFFILFKNLSSTGCLLAELFLLYGFTQFRVTLTLQIRQPSLSLDKDILLDID